MVREKYLNRHFFAQVLVSVLKFQRRRKVRRHIFQAALTAYSLYQSECGGLIEF